MAWEKQDMRMQVEEVKREQNVRISKLQSR
jgi:hypothetical protein